MVKLPDCREGTSRSSETPLFAEFLRCGLLTQLSVALQPYFEKIKIEKMSPTGVLYVVAYCMNSLLCGYTTRAMTTVRNDC